MQAHLYIYRFCGTPTPRFNPSTDLLKETFRQLFRQGKW